MAGRFDEKCPHCECKIDLYSVFQSKDYSSDFVFECPDCEGGIQVDVHTVPEFELSKAEGPVNRFIGR